MTSSAPRGSLTVLAMDPGSEQSAWVLWDGEQVLNHGKDDNHGFLSVLCHASGIPVHLAIEQIASYGMPVGAEVFETVRWAGRFEQAHRMRQMRNEVALVPRRDVKLHLCGQARAKDANIRQALIDRFGGKDRAIGKKASQGPLYGLKADEWQALALAVTWHDLHAGAASEAAGGVRKRR